MAWWSRWFRRKKSVPQEGLTIIELSVEFIEGRNSLAEDIEHILRHHCGPVDILSYKLTAGHCVSRWIARNNKPIRKAALRRHLASVSLTLKNVSKTKSTE